MDSTSGATLLLMLGVGVADVPACGAPSHLAVPVGPWSVHVKHFGRPARGEIGEAPSQADSPARNGGHDSSRTHLSCVGPSLPHHPSHNG